MAINATFISFYQDIVNIYGDVYTLTVDFPNKFQDALQEVANYLAEEKKGMFYEFYDANISAQGLAQFPQTAIQAVFELQKHTLSSAGLGSIDDFIEENDIELNNGFRTISALAGYPLS
jgi:hypothetical protein